MFLGNQRLCQLLVHASLSSLCNQLSADATAGCESQRCPSTYGSMHAIHKESSYKRSLAAEFWYVTVIVCSVHFPKAVRLATLQPSVDGTFSDVVI